MKVYETRWMKTSIKPSQLDFLRVANRRKLLQTSSEESLYRSLEMGSEGEEYVVEMLERYGQKHWLVVRNLWMDCQGIYESDIVLLTANRPYIFEVKNYNGLFEYKNNRCLMNGTLMRDNCIQQTEKALFNLQDICAKVDRSLIAKGALILAGEHNEVSIESKVCDIEVKVRSQLRHYIQEIVRLEETEYYNTYDIRRLLDAFEKRERDNPFGPHKSYTPQEVLRGKKGVYCKQCGTYEVKASRKYITCKNNHQEIRIEAILRMIHEFGLLTFDYDFMKQSDLRMYLDNQVSKGYLIKILNQHFTKVNNGKYTTYVNKKAQF